MPSHPTLPVRSIPIGADLELRIQALEDLSQEGQPVLDVRLYRRSSAEVTEIAFSPTDAGFRLPLHLSGLVADGIRQTAVRTAEQFAVAMESHGKP